MFWSNSNFYYIPKLWTARTERNLEPIKQVRKESVYKLLVEIDKDMDGKISLEELTDFVRKHGLRSITNNIIRAMYNEITGRRVVIKKHLQDKPITFEELRFCCNYW